MTSTSIFQIADFQIDLSRSVMIKDQQEIHIEPKVLQVLRLLAERQNEVVTHQEIMQQVWQGTEVVPNALQRCITILRKTFNDSAKDPQIIATHPRIGYRLIAPVDWTVAQNTKPLNEAAIKIKGHWPRSIATTSMLLVLGISTLLWLVLGQFKQSPPFATHFSQINRLTQTDAHETHAIYNPDGKYIVFNRYAGACRSHLWVRQVKSGKETQLTREPGFYTGASFTRDGRELVFAAKNDCRKIAQEPKVNHEASCWGIATLDFAKALIEKQKPTFRYQCQAESLVNPMALAGHQYAFLQYLNSRFQLIQYDDLAKTRSILYRADNDYIYDYDFDANQQRFVVIGRDKHLHHFFELLSLNGTSLRRQQISLPSTFSVNATLKVTFEPNGQFLLASDGKHVYQLNFDGQLQALDTPEKNIVSVVKHPKAMTLLAVQGHKDIDISEVQLTNSIESKVTVDLHAKQLPFTSISRTKAQEKSAKYQPEGKNIAFVSDRNKQDQIWLWHASTQRATQLTHVEHPQAIAKFSWSKDGKQLAWASAGRLAIVDLAGQTRFVSTPKPIFSVLSWYQPSHVIVLVNDPVPGGLYLFDLTTNTLTPYKMNNIEMAWVEQQQLYVADASGAVHLRSLDPHNASVTLLPTLNGKATVINKGYIYSVGANDLLLKRYDLQGNYIDDIKTLKPTAWKITDISGDNLLLSQFVAISHDIVELSSK